MRTIVIADAVMGLDNVLAVAGAAHGSVLLVVAGLVISIPIVVWGSTLILRWIERFPGLLYLGGAVLAWTAAKMIADEPLYQAWLDARPGVKSLLFVVHHRRRARPRVAAQPQRQPRRSCNRRYSSPLTHPSRARADRIPRNAWRAPACSSKCW